MDEIFIFRVILSFIIGGSYIAFLTRITELLGPKIGGVLSSTPTTALIGMIFLAIAEGNEAIGDASPGIVVGLSASVAVLAVYVYLRKNAQLLPSFVMSLFAWFAVAIGLTLADVSNPSIAAALFVVSFAISSWYLSHVSEVQSKKLHVGYKAVLMRVLFGGSVIASVLIVSRLASPFWGGLAGGFPAMYISSLAILEKNQGHAFTASVIKHMPMGSFSTVSFALTLGLIADSLSSAVSIVISFIVSLVVAYFVYLYKHRS